MEDRSAKESAVGYLQSVKICITKLSVPRFTQNKSLAQCYGGDANEGKYTNINKDTGCVTYQLESPKCIEDGNDVTELINGKTSHEEHSKSAMELATKIWPETDVRHCKESISAEVDPASLGATHSFIEIAWIWIALKSQATD